MVRHVAGDDEAEHEDPSSTRVEFRDELHGAFSSPLGGTADPACIDGRAEAGRPPGCVLFRMGSLPVPRRVAATWGSTALRNAGSCSRLRRSASRNTARSRPTSRRLGLGVGHVVIDREHRCGLELPGEARQWINEVPGIASTNVSGHAAANANGRPPPSPRTSPRFTSRAVSTAPSGRGTLGQSRGSRLDEKLERRSHCAHDEDRVRRDDSAVVVRTAAPVTWQPLRASRAASTASPTRVSRGGTTTPHLPGSLRRRPRTRSGPGPARPLRSCRCLAPAPGTSSNQVTPRSTSGPPLTSVAMPNSPACKAGAAMSISQTSNEVERFHRNLRVPPSKCQRERQEAGPKILGRGGGGVNARCGG